MGLWDSYKQRFMDNLRHGAGDGLKAAATGRSASEVAAERRAKQRRVSEQAILAYAAEKQSEYDAVVAAERARGNVNYPSMDVDLAYLDGVPVEVRFNRNGQRGTMEIFYGGGGPSPRQSPDNDYHGHIVIVDGEITSWEEPGVKGKRPRLY